jgi:hypothetical protein
VKRSNIHIIVPQASSRGSIEIATGQPRGDASASAVNASYAAGSVACDDDASVDDALSTLLSPSHVLSDAQAIVSPHGWPIFPYTPVSRLAHFT